MKLLIIPILLLPIAVLIHFVSNSIEARVRGF